MKTIYFVRHGECEANVQGLIAGITNDSPLTAVGVAQAEETAQAILQQGLEIDLVVASPLARTKDTAQCIADKIGYKGEIRLEPVLYERDFGSVSGAPRSTGFALIDAGKVPDVESLEDFADRQRKVLELFEMLPGKHILVVGHSGSEQMLRTIYEGRPYTSFLETTSLHCAQVREYEVDA